METGQLTRFDGWEGFLAEFTASAADWTFEWGRLDCCLLAADWVLFLTGHDFGAEFRGAYADEDGALQIIREFGGLSNLVNSVLGIESVNANLARRGDICLVDSPLGEALGVCIGARCLCAGIDGAVLLPMKKAKLAWRVG